MKATEKMTFGRLSMWRNAVVAFGVAMALAPPAGARPGLGYGQLIDKYCIERGRLRVAGHQNHCVMCHSPGTFDPLPEDRVEPNWTEFERGRSTGNFDFFCPGNSAADSPMSPMPMGNATSTTSSPASATSAPFASGKASAPMGKPPGVTPAPSALSGTIPKPSAAVAPRDAKSTIPAVGGRGELMTSLNQLHDSLGITASQQGAWRELADAISVAVLVVERSTQDNLFSRIKMRERFLSERISALRGVSIALARLDPVLDSKQKDKLAEEFSPILDQL